jgi:uncharacterized protein (DUF433 family)
MQISDVVIKWVKALTIGVFIVRRINMFEQLTRIAHNPDIMGGKACIKGTRITVGMILMQISEGTSTDELLREYPALTEEDITEALRYAAWAVGAKEELVVPA